MFQTTNQNHMKIPFKSHSNLGNLGLLWVEMGQMQDSYFFSNNGGRREMKMFSSFNSGIGGWISSALDSRDGS